MADKGPNLTWIFIGIAVAIVVLTISFSSYEIFLDDNNVSLDDSFRNTKSNLSEIQGDIYELGGTNGGLSDRSLLKDVWNAASGTVNVFVMGLAAISEFFRMVGIIDNVFAIMKGVIPGLNALFGLFAVIVTIYISISVLKAKRGSSEKA